MAVINPNTTVQSGGNQQTPNINAPGGSGAPMTSALSSAANTGSTAPSGSSAPATKAPNTQFTNVSAYLNANQGAGQKIANVVGSGLQSDVNNAQSTVDTTAQNFQNAVNAENNRLAQANQYLGTDSSGNQVFNGDATQVANNAQNYTNWQNLYNGTNVGELQSGLTNQAATAQNALTQAQTQVGQLGTESGRSQLLSQYLANPNYSAGQQNLDQLLFQVGGAQQLNNQQQSLNNTLTNLTNNQNTFQNSMQKKKTLWI